MIISQLLPDSVRRGSSCFVAGVVQALLPQGPFVHARRPCHSKWYLHNKLVFLIVMHAASATIDLRLGSGPSLGLFTARQLQHLCSVVQRSSRACRADRVDGQGLHRASKLQRVSPTASAAESTVASSDSWQQPAGQQSCGTPQAQQEARTSWAQVSRGSNEHAAGVTTWQQRQQQQGKNQQRRQQRQQRQQSAAVRPKPRQALADYSSYQCLYAAVQQLQQSQAGQCTAQGPQAIQQQQQEGHWQPLFSAADCVNFIEQLAVISRTTSASASSGVSNSSSFVEDQALLQILPLAYDTLDHYAHLQPSSAASSSSSPGTATARQLTRTQNYSTATAGLRPTDLLRCISSLAALKYNQPSRLAALLELKAAGRLGLSRLRMQQLAALVAGLAKAGVKPRNVWLVALMQEAERRLPAAKLLHLAQLLHGLVRMGVKPAASWLDSLQDQAVQCLIEQAVQCQVSMGHIQQQQALQDLDTSVTAATTQNGSGSASPSRQQANGQLHDLAQLLTAFAEAKHSPKLQLSAALWGGTADSLAVADVAALVEILSAVGELELVPPASWMQQYYSSTAVQLLQEGQYRPWQLAESVQALGMLVAAGMACCGSNSNGEQPGLQDGGLKDLPSAYARPEVADASDIAVQQEMHSFNDGITCSQWVAAVLSAAHQQLSSFAARDIAALLSGLAALQLPLDPLQLQPLLAEVQQKLPRLNTAGLSLLAKAAVQLEQQLKQQHQKQEIRDNDQSQRLQEQRAVDSQPPVLLTQGWMSLLLQEAAVKLPVFPAGDLAELLIVLAESGIAKPSSLWLEAAAVQLQGKLAVLEPGVLVQGLGALTAMGHQPNQQWFRSALAVLETRVVELEVADLAQLLAIAVELEHRPDRSFIAAARWALQQQQTMAGQQRLVMTGIVPAVILAGDVRADLVTVCERRLQQLE